MRTTLSALPIIRHSLTKPPTKTTRLLSTLPSNPHIYIHPNPTTLSESYILSYLRSAPTNPNPNTTLSIGSSTTNPPTPDKFTPNPFFLQILQQVLATHAHADPGLKAQAAVFASSGGSGLGALKSGGGGMAFAGDHNNNSATGRRRSKSSGGGGVSVSAAEGVSQAGYGSGGQTGFMHVADERNAAAYGRIPEPEDIFGCLQVGADGEFVDGHGFYQDSGTYRVLTRKGCLGLSAFLRERLVERLVEEERKMEMN